MNSFLIDRTRSYLHRGGLILLLLSFGIMRIFDLKYYIPIGLTLWEFLIAVFADGWFMVNFFFLIFLFFNFQYLRLPKDIEKIRCKTKSRFLRWDFTPILLGNTIVLMAFVFIAFFISIVQFPLKNEFLFASKSLDPSIYGTFEFYQKIFTNPFPAFLFRLILFWIGINFFSFLFWSINQIKGQTVVIGTIVFILMWMSLSFYGSLYDYSILFQLQSYWGLGLIEDHGVFEIIQILTVELVAMLILLGIYLSPKNRKKDLFIKEFFHYDKIWSIFMLLILVIYQVPLFLTKTNIADHLFRYFEGLSPNGFNLLTVFYDMGIVLLPIFFIGVRMEEFQNSYFSTVAIRYREKEDLQKKVFFQNLKNIAVYFIIYSILALILYLFSEGKDFLYYEEFPWKIKIFPLIIGKGFEMLFLYLLFFAILQLTKSRVLSFTLLLVIDVFFVFIPTPIGRMNIYWISELGEQCKILFLMNGLLFILIYYLLKKGVQDGKSHTIKKHQ